MKQKVTTKPREGKKMNLRERRTLTITVDNINIADAVALQKMFKHMQSLGSKGSSRVCSFYADGDGGFRPKVSFDYPVELPELEFDGRKPDDSFFIDSDNLWGELRKLSE